MIATYSIGLTLLWIFSMVITVVIAEELTDALRALRRWLDTYPAAAHRRE